MAWKISTLLMHPFFWQANMQIVVFSITIHVFTFVEFIWNFQFFSLTYEYLSVTKSTILCDHKCGDLFLLDTYGLLHAALPPAYKAGKVNIFKHFYIYFFALVFKRNMFFFYLHLQIALSFFSRHGHVYSRASVKSNKHMQKEVFVCIGHDSCPFMKVYTDLIQPYRVAVCRF